MHNLQASLGDLVAIKRITGSSGGWRIVVDCCFSEPTNTRSQITWWSSTRFITPLYCLVGHSILLHTYLVIIASPDVPLYLYLFIWWMIWWSLFSMCIIHVPRRWSRSSAQMYGLARNLHRIFFVLTRILIVLLLYSSLASINLCKYV